MTALQPDPVDSPLSVLLVEDELVDRLEIERSLRRAEQEEGGGRSYTLTEVGDLASALARLRAQTFDVVLLDLRLPDSQGMQTLQQVREQAGGAALVVITVLGDEVAGARALGAGAHEYLFKEELNPRVLRRAIRYAVERRKLERRVQSGVEELRAAEQRFRHLIEQMADAVVLVDKAGLVRWVNAACTELFQRPAAIMVGRPFGFELKVGGAHEIDIYNGERGIIGDMHVVETHWEREPVYLAVIRDVTERRNVDRMQREFISVISHELRTPLTSINGALRLLESGRVEPEQRGQLMTVAQRNVERLHSLIDDILQVGKLDARGELTMEARRIELVELVRTSIENISPTARARNIALEMDANAPRVIVFGDPARLNQVLENLLSNALEVSSPEQRVEVRITQRVDVVRVSVHDRGPGVPYEARHRIFGRFQQADSSDTRSKGGTGLGLTIAKAIVEQHEGRIGFESVPGQGATFWFDLPFLP